MTPEERAEAVGKALFSSESRQQECARMVKAAIRAAVEEAYQKGFEEYQHHIVARCANCGNSKAEAYKDAAKTMAEGARMYPKNKFIVYLFEALESRFRARAAEVGR